MITEDVELDLVMKIKFLKENKHPIQYSKYKISFPGVWKLR